MLNTITQILVPPEKQGRISSILSAMAMLMNPIGIIASGPLAKAIGYVPLFVGSISLGTISITLIWIFSNMRSVDPVVEELEEKEKELKKMRDTVGKSILTLEEDETPVPFPAD
jgi:MFS family permease